MKKFIPIVLTIAFVITCSFILSCYVVILPTESSSNKLMLVQYGYVAPERITLTHYIDDVVVCDYVLDLKIELRHQTTQTYDLPPLNYGRIDVKVDLKNSKGYVSTSCDVEDLYQDGLLIYFASDFYDEERHVYLYLGKVKFVIITTKILQNGYLQQTCQPLKSLQKQKSRTVLFIMVGKRTNGSYCQKRRIRSHLSHLGTEPFGDEAIWSHLF